MMKSQEILGCNSCFRGLEKDQLQELIQALELRQFQRNQVLWREGERLAQVAFVVTGLVKLVRQRASGKELIIDIVGTGRWLRMARPSEEVLGTSIVGLAQGAVALIDRQTFSAWLRRHPAVAVHLAFELSHEREALLVRFDEISAGTAEGRLAALFCRLIELEGKKTPDGVKLTIPLSRQDLASLVDITIETAIRIMSRWNHSSLVLTQQDGFLVPDLEALEDCAI